MVARAKPAQYDHAHHAIELPMGLPEPVNFGPIPLSGTEPFNLEPCSTR